MPLDVGGVQKEKKMNRDKFFIGGDWVDPAGTDTIAVISPHTEEVIARVPDGDRRRRRPRRRRRARARSTTGPWPQMSPAERADVMAAVCRGILQAPLARRSRETITERDGLADLVLDHGAGVRRRPWCSTTTPASPASTRSRSAARACWAHARAPRAGRRGRRHRAVERAAVRHHAEARPGARRRARRWCSSRRRRRRSTRTSSPRRCSEAGLPAGRASTSCRPVARSASTS